ncbi:MAG: hypothetical protein P8M16_01865 [Acidimicrobiales bacterium]|nr:hypothetical protein [Acidimicrobiales bacterium]
MQLFQRRRWIDSDRVADGLGAFVAQLAWINANTGMAMSGWRRTDPEGEPGAILATTIYEDHAWFTGEVAHLQTLAEYGPVNKATAALTVGQDAFERWDAPVDLSEDWALGEASFRQVLDLPKLAGSRPAWINAEGAENLVAWFPAAGEIATGSELRQEYWFRIY